MNKFILLLLGLLFFPHILDQIGLLLDFFFFFFIKTKILSRWSYSGFISDPFEKKYI